MLAPRPTPKLEDHPSSAGLPCLFNLFTATLHIGGRSSIRNLRTRHAVVTGIHIRGKEHPTFDKMKAGWIGRILLWNSLLKRFTVREGKTKENIAGARKEEEYVSSYWISLMEKILEF